MLFMEPLGQKGLKTNKTVGNKVCPGTEREEINSSRADTENTHVEINNGTDSTTKD